MHNGFPCITVFLLYSKIVVILIGDCLIIGETNV